VATSWPPRPGPRRTDCRSDGRSRDRRGSKAGRRQGAGPAPVSLRFYAAVALKQAEGDTVEAAFILRAFRSTMRRALRSTVARTDRMRVMRRISAAFKDVPGGQLLGPTRDYTIQLLDFSLLDEDDAAVVDFLAAQTEIDPARLGEQPRFPRVLDLLREEGLLAWKPRPDPTPPFDVTREALRFPAPRSAKLQTLARGETGALMALAYSTMRGYVGRMRLRAADLLHRTEIPTDRMDEPPSRFSGGMQQRVQIAKALASGPLLLLLDEITSGLDVSVQARVLDLIRSLQRQLGIAMLVVSHDLGVIRLLTDRTAVMRHGRIVEIGLTDQVLEDPQDAYSQLLVSSLL
jgi:Bacterial phosphonate metabolism protein (PhnI)/ABC transporter